MGLADVAAVVLAEVLAVTVGLLTCLTATGIAGSDCRMVAEAELVVVGHPTRKLDEPKKKKTKAGSKQKFGQRYPCAMYEQLV
jgi:hypothetical protein